MTVAKNGLSAWAKRQADAAPTESRILRPPQTVRVSGYSNMQLLRLEKVGRFPKKFKLNPDGGKYGAAGHDYQEGMAWMAARRASRSALPRDPRR